MGTNISRSKSKKYIEYLESDKWNDIRINAIRNANYKCQRCHRKGKLFVHHKIYPKIYGTETLRMLSVLCEKCHKKMHEQDLPRLSKFPPWKSKAFLKRNPVKIYTKEEIEEYLKTYQITIK